MRNSPVPDDKIPDGKPFTPSELAAPNPPLHRLVNARLEALLRKHAPHVFPKWTAKMIESGEGPDTNPQWGASLARVAAALSLVKRGSLRRCEEDTLPEADDLQERRISRNIDLLVRLIVKGCRARGEFRPR